MMICLLRCLVGIGLAALLSTAQASDLCVDCDSDGYLWPSDCNDFTSSTHPAAVEICDGYDNDCDGVIDSGASCRTHCDEPFPTAYPRPVTDPAISSMKSALVWTGAEYGVAWTDGLYVYFARLDHAGLLLAPPTRVTDAFSDPARVDLVWSGREFGLVWDDARTDPRRRREIFFARIDEAGRMIDSEIRVTRSSCEAYFPTVIWNGSEYALAWEDCRDGNWEIYLARLDGIGRKIGEDVRVTTAPNQSFSPALVWTGSGYGLAWNDLRPAPGNGGNFEIYFALLDADGNRLGDDIRVTHAVGSGFRPSLAWAGQEFGLAWQDRRDDPNRLKDTVYFALLDRHGHKVGTEEPLTEQPVTSGNPQLTWTGSEYGLVWDNLEPAGGGVWEIRFIRLNVAGTPLGEPVLVSRMAGASWLPALAWNGSGYGVTWDTHGEGTPQVHFTALACDCSRDWDQDGYGVCFECDDHEARIHPGAADLPGDAIDDDCDGQAACDPGADWNQHGQYVRCVTQTVRELLRHGRITDQLGRSLIRSAAHSDTGSPSTGGRKDRRSRDHDR